MKICEWHNCNNPVPIKGDRWDKLRKYCSFSCKNTSAVHRRRKKLKQMGVEYKGGNCLICKYKKCVGALVFHHQNPSEKEFSPSKKGHTISWERLKKELDKCVLLCANCHAEVHAGITDPP